MSTPRSLPMSCDMFTLPSARPGDLGALLDFTDGFCISAGVGDDDRFAIKLCIEEVSVNIMTHGYGQRRPGPIELSLCATPEVISIKIMDRAEPFDPFQAPTPNLEASWEERKIGGLGWHLVRELMDSIAYHYDPGEGNVVHLIRRRTGD